MAKLISIKPDVEVNLDNLDEQRRAMEERINSDPLFRKAVMEGHPEGNPVTLGPRVISATDWVNKQTEGAKARADTWLKNSLAPSKDPKQAALKAAGKWKSNMQAAITGGHYEKGISGYDEAARTTVLNEGGTAAFISGVDRHKAKAVAKVSKLQPKVAALAATLDGMPIDTDAQREAKLLAARRGMIAIGKELRG
jgi:hypothetical protein